MPLQMLAAGRPAAVTLATFFFVNDVRFTCTAIATCRPGWSRCTQSMQPAANASMAHLCFANHAMQRLYLKCPGHAYMRALFFRSQPSYQLGLTELAQQRSKAPRGSVPAEPPPEPLRSRRRGHPGTMPQPPTCINAGMGHMKHLSIQAYR